MKRETRAIVGRVIETVDRITSPEADRLPEIECPTCGHVGPMGSHVACPKGGAS